MRIEICTASGKILPQFAITRIPNHHTGEKVKGLRVGNYFWIFGMSMCLHFYYLTALVQVKS